MRNIRVTNISNYPVVRANYYFEMGQTRELYVDNEQYIQIISCVYLKVEELPLATPATHTQEKAGETPPPLEEVEVGEQEKEVEEKTIEEVNTEEVSKKRIRRVKTKEGDQNDL